MSLGQISKLPFCDIFIYSPDCSSSEGRPFRLGTGANMEKVVKMDRDMTKVHMLFKEKLQFCSLVSIGYCWIC